MTTMASISRHGWSGSKTISFVALVQRVLRLLSFPSQQNFKEAFGDSTHLQKSSLSGFSF
uniref:Uncharacterized protein n=1 Tax=Glossina pallidipes TaxID=7398 RepID=A0A1B0A330_GLOPL